jgi:anti-anti-sigma factor
VAISDPPALKTDEPFRVQITAGVDEVRIVMSGPLDLGSAADVRQLGIALRGTVGPVVLDLGEITFLDSSGITALVGLKGELDLQLRALSVLHVRPEALDVLRMVGVDELLGLTA